MWHKNIQAQNLLILLLSLAGLTGAYHMLSHVADLSEDEKWQVEKVTYRHLIDYLEAYPENNIDYYFLGRAGRNAEDFVLDDLSEYSAKIRTVSDSEIAIGFTSPVVYRSDRSKRGMIIDIRSTEIQPDGKVLVELSLYQDKGTAGNYLLELKRNDGEYHVISVEYPEDDAIR